MAKSYMYCVVESYIYQAARPERKKSVSGRAETGRVARPEEKKSESGRAETGRVARLEVRKVQAVGRK